MHSIFHLELRFFLVFNNLDSCIYECTFNFHVPVKKNSMSLFTRYLFQHLEIFKGMIGTFLFSRRAIHWFLRVVDKINNSHVLKEQWFFPPLIIQIGYISFITKFIRLILFLFLEFVVKHVGCTKSYKKM